MLLYRVNKEGTAVLHEDAVKLVPEFRKLNKQEVLFMICVCDFSAQYNKFPEEERYRRASRKIFKVDWYNASEQLQQAMQEYKDLQFDEKRYMIEVYQKKIGLLSQQILAEENDRILKAKMETQDLLRKKIKEVQREVEESQEEADIKGGGKKSFIEVWQENQRKAQQNKSNEAAKI